MKGFIGAFILVILLIIGGVFVYRSTEPNGEVRLDDTVLIEGEDSLVVPEGNSQFIQEQPASMPPVEDELLPPGAGTSDEAIISMTDTGFVPQVMTVVAGETVTFINNGQGVHWPASDVHPSHEILPGFDSQRGLATGDRYSYTFEEPGVWNCHDHLQPRLTCTITVN